MGLDIPIEKTCYHFPKQELHYSLIFCVIVMNPCSYNSIESLAAIVFIDLWVGLLELSVEQYYTHLFLYYQWGNACLNRVE